MLRKTFDLRQKSDYEIYTELDEELVKETVNNAEKSRARKVLWFPII